jgi:hypothetical protein
MHSISSCRRKQSACSCRLVRPSPSVKGQDSGVEFSSGHQGGLDSVRVRDMHRRRSKLNRTGVGTREKFEASWSERARVDCHYLLRTSVNALARPTGPSRRHTTPLASPCSCSTAGCCRRTMPRYLLPAALPPGSSVSLDPDPDRP